MYPAANPNQHVDDILQLIVNANSFKELIDLKKAVANGKKALAIGDFTAYGKAQKELEDALARAMDAQKRLNSASAIKITPASFVR